MDAARTIEAIQPNGLNGLVLSAIIAEAVLMARDPDYNKWDAYEVAKKVITGFNPTHQEYERAIRLLAGALGV